MNFIDFMNNNPISKVAEKDSVEDHHYFAQKQLYCIYLTNKL